MIKDFSIFQKMMLLKDNIAYLNPSINEEFRKDGQIYYNDFDDEKIKRIKESVICGTRSYWIFISRRI